MESEEFWIPVGLKKKFVVKDSGEIELAPGYLPLEEDINSFVQRLEKARPTLQQFNLVVYVDARFRRDGAHRLFEIHHDFQCGKKKPISSSMTAVLQADPGALASPHGDLLIHQAAIDHLHKRCLNEEDDYGHYGSDEDFDPGEWEWDMLEPYEEWADRDAYAFDYSTDEEEREEWLSNLRATNDLERQEENLEDATSEFDL